MRNLVIVVVVLSLVALFFGCQGVDGSGNAGSEARSPGSFDAVQVSGVIQLELTLGSAHGVELSGDDNLLPLVETSIEGGTLVIKTTRPVDPELPLLARVTAPDVRKVSGSGATKLHVSGVNNAELELELSGAGHIEAQGATKKVRIEISGAGDADATKLSAERVDVDVSGAGKVAVAEPKELDVDISGAGHVSYAGSPAITQSISGAGRLVKR